MFFVAHRTPYGEAACAQLAAAGARYFELDVQPGRDGVRVSHYLPVRRSFGLLERDNVRLRLTSDRPRDRTLADLARVVPAGCRILLDPKGREHAVRRRLQEQLLDELADRSRYCVSTSDPAELARYRDAGFETWRTLSSPEQVRAAIAGGPMPELGVSVRHTALDVAAVRELHRVTGTIAAWTVNLVGRGSALRAMGVDALTTDSLSLMRALAPAVGRE